MYYVGEYSCQVYLLIFCCTIVLSFLERKNAVNFEYQVNRFTFYRSLSVVNQGLKLVPINVMHYNWVEMCSSTLSAWKKTKMVSLALMTKLFHAIMNTSPHLVMLLSSFSRIIRGRQRVAKCWRLLNFS